jgi:8-oxo-dGTP pyrophosphatase MutT (NUDIX family)
MVLQSAAIPYRFREDGGLEVLLVTSRRKGRWVLPKGQVKPGTLPHSSAAKEAFEEAGVLGKVADKVIVSRERKRSGAENMPPDRLLVYPLLVNTEAPVWPEMRERERGWIPLREAIASVHNKTSRRALEGLEAFLDLGNNV